MGDRLSELMLISQTFGYGTREEQRKVVDIRRHYVYRWEDMSMLHHLEIQLQGHGECFVSLERSQSLTDYEIQAVGERLKTIKAEMLEQLKNQS